MELDQSLFLVKCAARNLWFCGQISHHAVGINEVCLTCRSSIYLWCLLWAHCETNGITKYLAKLWDTFWANLTSHYENLWWAEELLLAPIVLDGSRDCGALPPIAAHCSNIQPKNRVNNVSCSMTIKFKVFNPIKRSLNCIVKWTIPSRSTWSRSASFRLTQWLEIIPHIIRSYYRCCYINEPVIFSHCSS